MTANLNCEPFGASHVDGHCSLKICERVFQSNIFKDLIFCFGATRQCELKRFAISYCTILPLKHLKQAKIAK